MCRLDTFMGLKRLLPSWITIMNSREESVMPAKAGIQTVNSGIKSRGLDSGVRRNDVRKNRVSILTTRDKSSATFLFLVAFALTLAHAEFGAAQTLEKVRIGMPSLSLSFIAPQVA